MFNNEFYPTPPSLVAKMMDKVNWRGVKTVLDPSAGKGNILDAVFDKGLYSHRHGTSVYDCKSIEVDPDLQHILIGKGFGLLDSDFLEYDGGDHFDLILMNPPFSNGEHHLLKAINVMFSGQIVCILNAETIRNPYSNHRRSLVNQLDDLGATIEFIPDAFIDAERKTSVEVALIYINKVGVVERDVFDEATDVAKDFEFQGFEQESSVALKDDVESMVAAYNNTKQIGCNTILTFFKNHKHIAGYIGLVGDDRDVKNLTERVSKAIERFVLTLRKSYWLKLMDVPSITEKLTTEKRKEYRAMLEQRYYMEFTVRNVRILAANLSDSYIDTLTDSVLKLFERMTKQHAYYPEMNNNILHFNGWKTNNAYKVGPKVVLPHFNFHDIWSGWTTPYQKRDELNDIDRVMNYFDGGTPGYVSIVEALEKAFTEKQTRGVKSTYFEISVFKKGTMHLKFASEDILRRFNLFVCKDKKWLPEDYGRKTYSDMNKEEKEVVEAFEGKKNYVVMLTNEKSDLLRIAA